MTQSSHGILPKTGYYGDKLLGFAGFKNIMRFWICALSRYFCKLSLLRTYFKWSNLQQLTNIKKKKKSQTQPKIQTKQLFGVCRNSLYLVQTALEFQPHVFHQGLHWDHNQFLYQVRNGCNAIWSSCHSPFSEARVSFPVFNLAIHFYILPSIPQVEHK